MSISKFSFIFRIFDETDFSIWRLLATGYRDELEELSEQEKNFILNEDFWVRYVSSIFDDTDLCEIKKLIYEFYNIKEADFDHGDWQLIYVTYMLLKFNLNDGILLENLLKIIELQIYSKINQVPETEDLLKSLNINMTLFFDLLGYHLTDLDYYASDETLKAATEAEGKEFVFRNFLDFKLQCNMEIKNFLEKKSITRVFKKYHFYKSKRLIQRINPKDITNFICPCCGYPGKIVPMNGLETHQPCNQCGYQSEYDGNSKKELESYFNSWDKSQFIKILELDH